MTSVTITRRELHDLVWREPLSVVASRLGVSRNGLGKICDRLLIPCPGRGHWSRAIALRPPQPALSDAPGGAGDSVVISAVRAGSRRTQSRLSPERRREQLLESAAGIVRAEGVHQVTLRRVARDIGISEAQAHNHFRGRAELLIALARREVSAMNSVREQEVERGHDNLTRVTLSTIAYLRQVAERGALIQRLLNNREVREGLRSDHRTQTQLANRRMGDRLEHQYGVSGDLAYGAAVVLTAVSRRAGRLLAEGKIPLETAERLSLAIITAGNRGVARRREPAAPD